MSVKNQIKTFLLLAVLSILFLLIGSIWGKSGLTIAFLFALVMNIGAYFYSDKIVLKMYNAHLLKKEEGKEIHNMVEKLSKKSKIPKPKVFLIKSENPNAFATGRNPKNSSVALTSGIIELLNEKELEGVISHELSHVKNRDTLIQVVASVIVSAITYIAFMARFMAIFGGRDEDSGIFELLALAIVMPIAATLIQLAISRTREYMADKSGAELLGKGNGRYLADALEKLEKGNKSFPLKKGSKATSSLFIVNPFSSKGLLSLLSTHPSIQNRVKKLRSY